MALILEVVAGRDEVRQRVRVDAFPFTVGRGYGSDLILDDPYVDPAHARIVQDENGDRWLEDCDSLNGLIAEDRSRVARLRLASGASLHVGRTLLRVRDTSDEVAPALRDGRTGGGPSLKLGKLGLVGVIAACTVVFGLFIWLDSYERVSSGDQTTTLIGIAVLACVWAGLWAIASRITQHRFHMLEHLAVFSVILVATMLTGIVAALGSFLLPPHWLSETMGTVWGMLALTLLLTAHLAYASSMPLKRRATIGFSITAAFFLLGFSVSLAKRDDFTDVPSFVSTLAPVSASLIPADGPEELERAAAALKPEVEALRKKK